MNNHTPINERTFEFAVRITKLCSYLDKQPGTPRLLAAQLFRSGTSIGANYLHIFDNNSRYRNNFHNRNAVIPAAFSAKYLGILQPVCS